MTPPLVRQDPDLAKLACVGDSDDPAALPDLPAVDLGRRFVRIRGRQDNGFIEFDFSVGWPDLVVELVLAPADFEAFCREHDVRLLASAAPADAGPDVES